MRIVADFILYSVQQSCFISYSLGAIYSYHISEYAGKPMRDRIDWGDYSMEQVKKWTREMLVAVQHLHSNGVSITIERAWNLKKN